MAGEIDIPCVPEFLHYEQPVSNWCEDAICLHSPHNKLPVMVAVSEWEFTSFEARQGANHVICVPQEDMLTGLNSKVSSGW
jgi:hypothetical protein